MGFCLFVYLFIYLQTYQVITYIVYITVLYFRQLTFYNLLLLAACNTTQCLLNLQYCTIFHSTYSTVQYLIYLQYHEALYNTLLTTRHNSYSIHNKIQY